MRIVFAWAFLAALLLLGARHAGAQVATPTQGNWDLYVGTSRVSTHPNEPACVEAARIRGAGNYGCRTITRVSVTAQPVCPPQPAQETRTQSCPTGTVGTWQQTRTYLVAPHPVCWTTGEWLPSSPPEGACVTDPAPVNALHFSDCQTGAASSCVLGNNANPGTAAAPKRDLTGINLNTLPAGSTLLFARGGSWNMAGLRFENLNVSAEAPLTLDAYGTGERPLFRRTGATMFQFGGNWGNTSNDAGYVIRNIVADGLDNAANSRGVWLVQNVSDVRLENVALLRFWTGIESSQGSPHNVVRFALRNSDVSFNSHMGFNGRGQGFTFDGNRFESNNFSGSGFNHAIYLSYGGSHVIRGNTFVNNSTVNGRCTGGNMTLHGVIDGLLIEGNKIDVPDSDAGCYGISVTAGHDTVESFRNVVIRQNAVSNVGMCAVCVNSAPGVVIDGNVSHTPGGRSHFGAWAEANGRTDTPSDNATVTNNVVCQAASGGNVAVVNWTPAGLSQSGNVLRTGADATTGVCQR
jgi:hypothetical protein